MHATYPIWRALLEESFEAIEKILNSGGKLSTINLNHCFLPSIRIANRLKADKVQFVSSYILGADLRGLSPGVSIALADQELNLDPYGDFVSSESARKDQVMVSDSIEAKNLNEHDLLEYEEIKLPPRALLLPRAKRDLLGKPIE
jgi:hypothetical protein